MDTVEDFWRMVWEQNVPIIVMLTKLEERDRVMFMSSVLDDYSCMVSTLSGLKTG